VTNPKSDQTSLQNASLYRRPSERSGCFRPWGMKTQSPAIESPCRNRAATVNQSNVDLVRAPVIQERHEQRTFRDLDSVYAGEYNASTNPARVLDGNRVSRGSIIHPRLVLVPSPGDAGIDRQERSAEPQTEQAFDPRALQPAGRTGVPGPAAVQPPRPTWGAVEYMSAHTT